MSTAFLTNLTLESDPELPAFFLHRLASLVARQAAAVNPAERAALGAATFSVFLDCLDLGLEEQAQAIVGRAGDEARAA